MYICFATYRHASLVTMKPLDKARPDRTHAIRTQINLTGMQGLVIEQGNRQASTGKKARLVDIAADWLEERAQDMISKRLKI